MKGRKLVVSRECWWLHPLAVIFCMHLPIVLLAHAFSEQTYEELWGTPKYLDSHTLILFLCCLSAIALGYAAGTIEPGRPARSASTRGIGPGLFSVPRLRRLFVISFGLTSVGLGVWLIYAVRNGFNMQALASFFSQQAGASSLIKQDYFTTLPGVTTMTQFGMSAAILAFILYRAEARKTTRLVLIALFVLNTIRALVLSERLSLIEVVVPVVVLAVHFKTSQPAASKTSKVLLSLAPILGVALIFSLFTAMEAFRTWTFYSTRSDSILAFGAGRLSGYYVTAINNSGLIFEHMPSSALPFFTQPWFWKMPILKNFFIDSVEANGMAYGAILQSLGNPEFNNPGGIFATLHDFGVPGSLLYCTAFGFAISRVYISFRQGKLAGLLLYPLAYVGLLEVSRILYLNDGRSFPSLALLVLATFTLRPLGRKRPAGIDEFAARQRDISSSGVCA